MKTTLLASGVVCALLCLASLSACSGSSRLPDSAPAELGVGQSAPADAKPGSGGFGLADPEAVLRGVSDTGEGRFRTGSEYEAELANLVSSVGNRARFAPNYVPPFQTMSNLSYAVYSFDLTGAIGEADVTWEWYTPPASPDTEFIGLGNFAGNHWEWYGSLDEGNITLEDIAPYKSASEQLLVAVVLTGNQPAVLDWIKAGGNIAPTARLLAFKQPGNPPSFDLDASSSSDVDGTIVLYEWDWDNDGTFDDSGTEPVVNHVYSPVSPERAAVRVTDDLGATDTADVELAGYDEVEDNDDLEQANALPALPIENFRGNLGAGGYDGDLDDYFSIEISEPGYVTFFMYHIDEQADLDMKLLADNGDGTTTTLKSSTSTSDDETFDYEFTEAGTYYWYIYVFSGAPDEAVADYKLAAVAGHSEKPMADIVATPTEGDAPLAVHFDAAGSTDPEGAIVLYEFDFDGDGTYDTSSPSEPAADHTYTLGGDYTARVRVTDDFGWTDTDTVTVSVYGPPPTASFTATPGSGERILTVEFDASGSGGMDKYEWDFDGDGRIDLTRYGAGNFTATAVYFSPGSYEVLLTVTDNQDRTDSTTRTVTVTGGPDSESEPNNDDQTDNTQGDADLADSLPAFPFADYFGHVGPKPVDGGDFGDPDDWFTFTLVSAAEVDFYLELYDNVCDIDMKLYAEGDYEDYLASSAGVDDDEQITEQLEPGTYYLRIYAFTSEPAAGGYRLSGAVLP